MYCCTSIVVDVAGGKLRAHPSSASSQGPILLRGPPPGRRRLGGCRRRPDFGQVSGDTFGPWKGDRLKPRREAHHCRATAAGYTHPDATRPAGHEGQTPCRGRPTAQGEASRPGPGRTSFLTGPERRGYRWSWRRGRHHGPQSKEGHAVETPPTLAGRGSRARDFGAYGLGRPRLVSQPLPQQTR